MKNMGKAIWYGLGFAVGGLVVGVVIGVILTVVNLDKDHDYIWNGVVVGLLVGLTVGIVVGIIISSRDDRKRLSAEAAESRRLQLHREEQEKLRQRMVALSEQSVKLFESMPKHLRSAEGWLDRAEADFAEGAFAPFWDSIENAANSLARFDEAIRQINRNSSLYTGLIGGYEDTPPEFQLTPTSVGRLSVGTTTAERMSAIVRAAQRSFQFASIYEQRKTNRILVEGFNSLGQALGEMTWQINTSIDGLTDSVHRMTSTLNTSQRAIHSTAGDIAEMSERHHDQVMEKNLQAAERERTALEMLDRIERERRRLP